MNKTAREEARDHYLYFVANMCWQIPDGSKLPVMVLDRLRKLGVDVPPNATSDYFTDTYENLINLKPDVGTLRSMKIRRDLALQFLGEKE